MSPGTCAPMGPECKCCRTPRAQHRAQGIPVGEGRHFLGRCHFAKDPRPPRHGSAVVSALSRPGRPRAPCLFCPHLLGQHTHAGAPH